MTRKITKGIIICADYGLTVYDTVSDPYLMLEVHMEDNFRCYMEFHKKETILELLETFKGDYVNKSTVKTLVHKTVVLLETDEMNIPVAIAPYYLDDDDIWIYHENGYSPIFDSK